jgi:hypothetical protein
MDIEAQIPSEFDEDLRGSSAEESFLHSLHFLLGIEIVYEYYTTYNSFVLFIRLSQMVRVSSYIIITLRIFELFF